MSRPLRSVAVIGAGMAGLTCATSLTLGIEEVHVYERGLHPGGRIASQREQGFEFDAGAQFFTVRDPQFRDAVETWAMDRVVAPWQGWVVDLEAGDFMTRERDERFVGVPAMSALAKHLGDLCELRLGREVIGLRPTDSGWVLRDALGDDLGCYDFVVIATPPPAAGVLLNGSAAALAERLRALEMTRCWALMLGFDAPLGLPYDAAYVQGSALSWLARNSAKPGRAERESWVAHASPEWSEGRGDLDPMQVTRELTEAFDAAVGGHTPRASARAVRLWDAAAPIASLGEPYLLDLDLGLGLCGDWCLGPRVEAAFLSGLGLAEALLVAAEAP